MTDKELKPTIRKDYIRRLIAGVRKQMAKDPRTIEAVKEFGEEVTIGAWLDASILCCVIEKDILGIDPYSDLKIPEEEE